MPFDGTEYQPEQSLEERALRHALAFFSGPEKWWQDRNDGKTIGSTCVGLLMIRFYDAAIRERSIKFDWVSDVLDVQHAPSWNDAPDMTFATMIAHLRKRIKHYEDQRMKVAA